MSKGTRSAMLHHGLVTMAVVTVTTLAFTGVGAFGATVQSTGDGGSLELSGSDDSTAEEGDSGQKNVVDVSSPRLEDQLGVSEPADQGQDEGEKPMGNSLDFTASGDEDNTNSQQEVEAPAPQGTANVKPQQKVDTPAPQGTADVKPQKKDASPAPKGEAHVTPMGIPEVVRYINEYGEDSEIAGSACKNLSDAKTGWLPLKSGWYAATRSVTLHGRASCDGDVKIILFNGAKLVFDRGINVGAGKSLTVYAQSTGDDAGELVGDHSQADNKAGIGGGDGEACGTILICGGKVTGKGGKNAAGIGGGEKGMGGSITVRNGKVSGTGGYDGAGIGGGSHGACGEIRILGGVVRGNGGERGAGIGNGRGCNFGGKEHYIDRGKHRVEIRDARVIGDGGAEGSGIGCGQFNIEKGTICQAFDFECYNAHVTADGWGEAGISCPEGSKLRISGGRVEATAHEWSSKTGAGIGGNDRCSSGSVSIEDSAVVVAKSDLAAAIGRGCQCDPMWDWGKNFGPIRLYDGAKVTAEKVADANLRVEFCKWRRGVTIEPCEHTSDTYERFGDGHAKQCTHCKRAVEPHVYDEQNVCTVCGDHRSDHVFLGEEVTHEGRYGMTFWLERPAECLHSCGDAVVELSIGGKNARTVEVPFVDGHKREEGGYGFTLGVSPIEMGEQVSCTLRWDGHEIKKVSSVMDCAKAAIEQHGEHPRIARMTVGLGHFMQQFLAAENKFVPGKDYAKADSPYVDGGDVSFVTELLEQYRAKVADRDVVKRLTMSASFGEQAKICLFLVPGPKGLPADMTARFGERDAQVSKLKDGRTLVEIDGIGPEELDRPICLYAADGKPLGVEASLLSYALAQVEGGKSEAKTALSWLYLHFEECRDLVNGVA